jgi:xanthine dehydrogenase YagT iron-sulfur-binding subunit
MHDTPPSDPAISRRSFLQTAGASAAGAALVGNAAPARGQAPAAPPATAPGLQRIPATGQTLSLKINGQPTSLFITPNTTLLAALREQAGLTGSKEVCDRGACGACTVLVDGRSINSCLTLAVDCVGKEITTAEGFGADGKLDAIQQAFVDHDACQCGYCIPGFVVRSHALLNETPAATPEQIREGLAGNVCRCGAYVRIFRAVEAAAKGGRS